MSLFIEGLRNLPPLVSRRRNKLLWLPYQYALNESKPGETLDNQRLVAAGQFSDCVRRIQSEWTEESTKKGIRNSLGEKAALSPTLAVRALIKHLHTSDYLGNYGPLIDDDVFDTVLQHHSRFAMLAYSRVANPFLAGMAQLERLMKPIVMEKLVGIPRRLTSLLEGDDRLEQYLDRLTIRQLESTALDFASKVAWMFLSQGDQFTERDLKLLAMYFNDHTSFYPTFQPEDFTSPEMLPLSRLGEILLREGRKPTEEEKRSVSDTVQAIQSGNLILSYNKGES